MIRHTLFLGWCIVIATICTSFKQKTAAPLPVYFPEYQSVDYSKNLIYKPDNLQHFYSSLDNYVYETQKKVVITHIGDSHIQADFLTHTARKLFQKTFGNGGRGFVFPFRIIRSNSPLNLGIKYDGQWTGCRSISSRDKCNFGITGATATTFDSTAYLRLNPNLDGDMNYEFNKLKLFSYHTPLSFDVNLLNGDSLGVDFDYQPINNSVSEIYFKDMQDSLWIAFDKGEEQGYFQLFGMSFENANPGVIYNAVGLNGAYAKSYLRNTFFTEQLEVLESDLVIISLGTNDAYMSEKLFCKACFKDSYESLIKKVKESNPNASLLFVTPGDFYVRRRYHNSNIDKVVESIYELAESYNASVWDFNKLMGGNYSIRKWQSDGLARADMIHYSEEGYILQGKMLYQSIMDGYEKRFE
ncbi:MAG: lysophospholipase L1-like esterase [Bacteroidia bacterium]